MAKDVDPPVVKRKRKASPTAVANKSAKRNAAKAAKASTPSLLKKLEDFNNGVPLEELGNLVELNDFANASDYPLANRAALDKAANAFEGNK